MLFTVTSQKREPKQAVNGERQKATSECELAKKNHVKQMGKARSEGY